MSEQRTLVHLLRHGEVHNPDGVLYGRLPDFHLSEDGVHLNVQPANGPATDENLKKCGYLLRCFLAVHKGMEVKAKVLDAK